MLKRLGAPNLFLCRNVGKLYIFDKNSKKMQKESTKRITNMLRKGKEGVDVSDSDVYGENVKVNTPL